MNWLSPKVSSMLEAVLCAGIIGWVLWRWLKQSDDPPRLISKWIISGALSRALKARDGHCRWPGCERSASICDGHHLVHWINGGPTDLENLVLLCRRHHRMVHEGEWQLVKTEGQVVTVAPMVTFGLPRGPD